MHVRVITSCTGVKQYSPDDQLKKNDFWLVHDVEAFAHTEKKLERYRTPAAQLYTGQQHLRLMDGVHYFQEEKQDEKIDVWIVSAGYGLIRSERPIVPYECTFQGMKVGEIREWAQHLQIPETARELFAQPADLNIIVLGDSYLRALELDNDVTFAAPTLFFTGRNSQKQVKGKGPIRIATLSNPEAKRFSCGLVGLKGELTKRILHYLAEQGESGIDTLFDAKNDVLALLDTISAESDTKAQPAKSQPSKKKSGKDKSTKHGAIPNPAVNQVIQIPSSWWDKPHRDKLRYFIPEWDDLVDPDYDFLTDTHSGGQGDWSNEVYAHQMYPEPNYDGILISKVVAEKSKKKKERINEMGVHRYLRVPREFPIMGDCGAFGYIKEEVPPYTTAEILDYYTRLDFDFGVSIDHLIVTATEEQKQFRYELTINNAEEFLREHQKLGLDWTPIGAVQGWDAESYAEAARNYVDMGYKYIGLGGMVRSKSQEIFRVLDAVQKAIPKHILIHIFGVARLSALNEFSRLGVASVDSAAYLRRAWMGSGKNYYTMDGEKYAAIRIPEAGKSFRAKNIVSDGRATFEQLQSLDAACLAAVRKFDLGTGSVEQTLEILHEYDQLITPDRPDNRDLLRKTLEATPWKYCPCDICQKYGVEVIIFRGNNRNRRRGFHNTYVLYQQLQQVLNGELQIEEETLKLRPEQLSLF